MTRTRERQCFHSFDKNSLIHLPRRQSKSFSLLTGTDRLKKNYSIDCRPNVALCGSQEGGE